VPVPVEGDAPPSALLLRARALIESHDTAAVECMRALAASLSDQASMQEPLKRLEVSIESYNFELARLELDALDRAFAATQPASRYKADGA